MKGVEDFYLQIEPEIVRDVLASLVRNAIESTPDEGKIMVLLEPKDDKIFLKVYDYGVGITKENLKYIFDGLYSTSENEFYTTKKAYQFNAGGKGLDLIKIKIQGKQFGLDVSAESKRCIYLPKNEGICPGRISLCHDFKSPEDCLASGGSIFSVSFPLAYVI